MSTCPGAETLARLHAEELPETDRLALSDHVRSCSRCQHDLAQLSGKEVRPGELQQATTMTEADPARTTDHVHRLDRSFPEVPGYRVERELGRGGMGVVYLAWHLSLKRHVALKMILPSHQPQPGLLARFRREAEAVAQLQHPNIVQIHEIGEHEGYPFLALEFVEGGSLAQFLNGKPQQPRQAALLAETLARAIHAAHEKGIVHRDLKPANVLLSAVSGARNSPSDPQPVGRGHGAMNSELLQPKIADFGLAKRLDNDSDVTHAGDIIGTPRYMAPEQASGQTKLIGTPTDIYALGVILYEMLTGRAPFLAESKFDTLELVRTREPIPPRQLQPHVPRDLETICLKCLRKEPGQRYPSASHLTEDLRRFLGDLPIEARPVGAAERGWRWCRRNPALASLAAAVVVVLLLGIAFSVYFGLQASHKADEVSASAGKVTAARHASDRRAYAGQSNLAQRLLRNGLIEPALQVLDGQRPGETDDVELRGWEWYYLKRLCHSELVNLTDVPGTPLCIAFNPDGTSVASAGMDGQICLWDTASGQKLQTLLGHTDRVNCVRFGKDGKHLASASADTTVRLWDLSKGKEKLVCPAHVLEATCVAFAPDGKLLAAGSRDSTVKLWEVDSGRELATLQGHSQGIACLEFSPDGKLLASGGNQDELFLWDMGTRAPLRQTREHPGGISALAFSKDGRRFASGGADKKIQVWETATGRLLHTLTGHTLGISGLVFGSDNNRIYSASHDHTIRAWDVAAAKSVDRFLGHSNSVSALAGSVDGLRLASASSDGTAKVWDTRSSQGTGRQLAGHLLNVTSIAFSKDGNWLVSGSYDQSVRVWNLAEGRESATLGKHVYSWVPSQAGTGRRLESIDTFGGHQVLVSAVAFRPDGQMIASGSYDNTVRLWNPVSAADEVACLKHPGQVAGLAFSPDGRRLATACWDDTVRIWDVAERQVLTTLKGHESHVTGVAYRNDNRQIASAGWDRTVRIWDSETGQQLHVLRGHEDRVACLLYNESGSLLASAGLDATIRIWDPDSGQLLHTLVGHTEGIKSLAFSPDGRRLASVAAGTNDRDLRLWDLTTGQELLAIADASGAVAFSPDGHQLAAVGPGNVIRVFEDRPVDDQPYRLGRFTPPEKAVSFVPTTGQTDGGAPGVKVLGTFVTPALPTSQKTSANSSFLRPEAAEERFCVVLLSVPYARMRLSESAYAKMVRDYQLRKQNDPVPARELMYSLAPSRFHLITPDGRRLPAKAGGPWPESVVIGGPGSYLTQSYVMTSSEPKQPSRRELMAVAWPLRPDTLAGCRVQIDEEEPVPLPDLRVRPAHYLAPPADRKLSTRLEHDLLLVRFGGYDRAVADAGSAAADAQASGSNIYSAACVAALAVQAVSEDESLSVTARQTLADKYAQLAMSLLKKANAKGYPKLDRIRTDPDLDALRQRTDYQDWMKMLRRTG